MKTSVSLLPRFAATHRYLFDPAAQHARCPGLLRCGVAAAALLLLTPVDAVVTAAEDETPVSEQADAVATPMPPEGKQMLMVTLGLAGLLIGMERGCSWRLGVCQHRDQAAHKLLTPAVPLLPVIVPPLPAT